MAMIHDVRCANARFSPWRVAGRGRHRSANHLGPGRRAAALLWLGAALLAAPPGNAQAAEAEAHYLANEGVMVSRGETRILFDPLFENDYGHYQLLPEAMREALLAGRAPYDGVDAVFVSHYHEDHFSPALLVEYLRAQPTVRLYAPAQAVAALREAAGADWPLLEERVTPLALAYGGAPVIRRLPGLEIEAVRIPHAGWPRARTEVENLAFRITLEDAITVLHLGDADTRDLHFAHHADHWAARTLHLALPPYWFMTRDEGRQVLTSRLRALRVTGIHVPTRLPSEPGLRPPEYRALDLFTRPGEIRRIPQRVEGEPGQGLGPDR
ncbi:MAG: MBL fold metallo-hydrolase [Xanthomonadales bacterium]|nr:MBL fold metallo-hydrolase [Xanthomonadales bacterium]NIN58245.1 MBL fold metallo-hydrolase [Xanthomonadales bacterium]NIN73597.1 MBL fold metallo-hydrolase [Xanthomonadales bacterium]NIO13712.1 MBL fold metallo-hydrolase [Xanthomonadales bacterium]NIP10638.1 MBL fold metallo-hydrolase [Xanthomonadales bacterium]